MTFNAKAKFQSLKDDCRVHLAQMQETYDEHLGFALKVSFILFSAGILLLIHALVPAWCKDSASKRIFRLADEIRARQSRISSDTLSPGPGPVIDL